jgi:hypothetical protein
VWAKNRSIERMKSERFPGSAVNATMRRAEASGANGSKLANSNLVNDLIGFTGKRHLFRGWSTDECTNLHVKVPQILFPQEY